jgi:hypothetical protein
VNYGKNKRKQKPAPSTGSGQALSKVEGTEVRRQKSVLCPLFSVLCVLMLAGCAQKQKYETVEQIYVPDMDKTEAMQIAEDALAKMHFTIEKADYESGIIRTKPLPAAQFFEFWRSDNIGAYNAAEANLHSIRRIVELHISQQDTKLSIDCDVQVQRLNLPVSRESGKRLSSQRPARLTRITGATWTDLGKDAKLATKILKRIQKHIVDQGLCPVSRTSDESQATSDEK